MLYKILQFAHSYVIWGAAGCSAGPFWASKRVRFPPLPAGGCSLFRSSENNFFFFRFGTAAQPAAMGTLDGFWFFFLVERIIAAFSLAYWPGLHSVSGFASGLH